MRYNMRERERQTDRRTDGQTDRRVEEVEEVEEVSYGMLERCRVEEGGKMFWKFLEPGFLKRWRGDPEKSAGRTNHMLRTAHSLSSGPPGPL